MQSPDQPVRLNKCSYKDETFISQPANAGNTQICRRYSTANRAPGIRRIMIDFYVNLSFIKVLGNRDLTEYKYIIDK